uniref:Uncharacterized protein n=1 Tax=Anopheles darlingi TaxID=43151 RepID=A0A2M4DQR6_ANODA
MCVCWRGFLVSGVLGGGAGFGVGLFEVVPVFSCFAREVWVLGVFLPGCWVCGCVLDCVVVADAVSLGVFWSLLSWFSGAPFAFVLWGWLGCGVRVSVPGRLCSRWSIKVYHELRYNTTLNNPCYLGRVFAFVCVGFVWAALVLV